ncbi:hypothetical protein QJQ45_008542 [Haematococcus lacustris]|nr:hypothetical protein QJQ45_008542 [Haematococcus lacustris]
MVRYQRIRYIPTIEDYHISMVHQIPLNQNGPTLPPGVQPLPAPPPPEDHAGAMPGSVVIDANGVVLQMGPLVPRSARIPGGAPGEAPLAGDPPVATEPAPGQDLAPEEGAGLAPEFLPGGAVNAPATNPGGPSATNPGDFPAANPGPSPDLGAPGQSRLRTRRPTPSPEPSDSEEDEEDDPEQTQLEHLEQRNRELEAAVAQRDAALASAQRRLGSLEGHVAATQNTVAALRREIGGPSRSGPSAPAPTDHGDLGSEPTTNCLWCGLDGHWVPDCPKKAAGLTPEQAQRQLGTHTLPEHDELKQQIQDLLAKGMIEPSSSPYAAPVLFVQKKSGELRMCIDYRQLNKITLRDQYPLPRIDDLFDKLSGCKVFSSLDLQAGYHQIRITPEDVPKTAFRTPEGHFQFKVLCFGLTNAPATFQRVMNDAFATVLGKCALVYLDDILVMSNRKLSPAEINYTTGEQEFLSLVTACKEWRCYLEGVPFTLFTDHQPLVALPTQKVLSRRQARWMEFMSRFSYSLVHIAGTVNPADPLSRIVHDSPESVSVCAVTTRRQAKLSLEGGGAREAGLRAAAPAAISAKSPLALSQFEKDTTCVEAMLDPIGSETPVTQIETAQYPAAPAAPMGLSDQLTLRYQQDPAFTAGADHSGMYQDTDGLWRISGYRWEHVSMDLVTKLPTGTHGYDAICVIVDRLSKMVHFVPCKESMNAMAFTRLFINNVFRYKRHADTGLKDVEFEVGAQVLLSTRNLRIKTGKVRKFVPRYVGPFVVEAKINANAYRLTLPATTPTN